MQKVEGISAIIYFQGNKQATKNAKEKIKKQNHENHPS